MNRKIKSLIITGLKECQELNYTINFSDEFQEDNIFPITGPNGSGKTMVLDILSRAFSREYDLPYINSISEAYIELEGEDNFVRFTLKNADKPLNRFAVDERCFYKTTQTGAFDKLPKVLAVLDRRCDPELSYILNPEPDMDAALFVKINKWFGKFDMSNFTLEVNETKEPEFRIWGRRLTEKDIRFMSSGDIEILTLLDALLTIRYDSRDILLYDDMGLHLHPSTKLLLKNFISEIKPEDSMVIYTTHSVEVLNFKFKKAQDLFELNKVWKNEKES